MYTIEEYKTLLKALKLYRDMLVAIHSTDVDEIERAKKLISLLAQKLTIVECKEKKFIK